MQATKRKNPRDAFDVGDKVFVAYRGYGSNEDSVREGVIIRKDTAFAAVRFELPSGKYRYDKVSYKRLMAIESARVVAEQQETTTPARQSKRTLRVVPPADLSEPSQPHPHTVHGELLAREERERAQEPPRNELRAVPAAFASLMASANAATAQSSDVIDAEGETVEPSPVEQSSDLTAWLEMGQALFPTLEAAERTLREQSRQLADKAQALLDASDAKLAEADGVKRHLEMLAASIERRQS